MTATPATPKEAPIEPAPLSWPVGTAGTVVLLLKTEVKVGWMDSVVVGTTVVVGVVVSST